MFVMKSTDTTSAARNGAIRDHRYDSRGAHRCIPATPVTFVQMGLWDAAGATKARVYGTFQDSGASGFPGHRGVREINNGYLTTGTFTNSAKDVFTNVVKDKFNNTAREAVLEAKNLYKMLTTSKLFERTGQWAGLPRGIKIAEGGEIPIYSPVMGNTKDYTQETYGLGFRVSKLFKLTEQWGVVGDLSTNLKMNQLELKEAELAKLWN